MENPKGKLLKIKKYLIMMLWDDREILLEISKPIYYLWNYQGNTDTSTPSQNAIEKKTRPSLAEEHPATNILHCSYSKCYNTVETTMKLCLRIHTSHSWTSFNC